jgi:hypothetical protein
MWCPRGRSRCARHRQAAVGRSERVERTVSTSDNSARRRATWPPEPADPCAFASRLTCSKNISGQDALASGLIHHLALWTSLGLVMTGRHS